MIIVHLNSFVLLFKFNVLHQFLFRIRSGFLIQFFVYLIFINSVCSFFDNSYMDKTHSYYSLPMLFITRFYSSPYSRILVSNSSAAGAVEP